MEKEADPPDNQEVVYHYSRARRLARASETVRALNDETPAPRPNLFRTLTATKPLVFLFISIVMMVVFISLISLMTASERVITLGGNTLTVDALRFQGLTYLAIKKTCKKDDQVYTGAVDVAVSPVLSGEGTGESPPISGRRIFFSLNSEEEFRFSLPFEATELLILIQTERDRKSFKIKVE
ncbi:MAG: hypothetical protein LBT93_09255 [Treponema sp.]|jgi:hypothetical protein|nr:hypothetical protein [Treponema sp.]